MLLSDRLRQVRSSWYAFSLLLLASLHSVAVPVVVLSIPILQLYKQYEAETAWRHQWFRLAGPSKMVKGQLISLSVDVYLVFEYCELGDLFHYRCDLSPTAIDRVTVTWQNQSI